MEGGTFEPSKLGTKQYWDDAYKVELDNFDEFGDEGEIWFGKQCEKRIIDWIGCNFSKEKTRILDVGSGNGHLLLSLARREFRCLTGIDYSANAVALGRALFTQNSVEAHFEEVDFLDNNCEFLGRPENRFDLIIDKGTFDAISLMPGEEDSVIDKSEGSASMNRIKDVCGRFKRSLMALCKDDQSQFIITSCNWTRAELEGLFGPELQASHQIDHPSFSFGLELGFTHQLQENREMLSAQEAINVDQPTISAMKARSELASDPLDLMEIAEDHIPENNDLVPDEEPNPVITDLIDPPATVSLAQQLGIILKNNIDLKAAYQVASNGAIKLRGRFGFRGHPFVVLKLAEFFGDLYKQVKEVANGQLSEVIMDEKHVFLIGMLVQESMVLDPTEEVKEILLPFCDQMLKPLHELPMKIRYDQECLDLSQLFQRIASIKYYGLSNALQSKKSTCYLWEASDRWIYPQLRAYVIMRRETRISLAQKLNDEYEKLIKPIPIVHKEAEPVFEESIEASRPSTPIKQQRGKAAVKQAPASSKPNQKLSSFFTVVKKSAQSIAENEYFQPFYLKEHCTMAPINYFSDYMMMAEEDTQADPLINFWDDFRGRAKKSHIAYRGKPQASCLGSGDGSRYFTVKLVQFHENFRPAYFGSSMKLKPSRFVNGRRPFGKDPSLDYEVDSDDEWAEEEAIEDAEDILSDEDDEDEEDDADADLGSSEQDEWLVPEGEGPLAEEDCDLPTFKRQSYKKGEKKKYIQLQPLMYGPYFLGQSHCVPDMIRTVQGRILPCHSIDPFSGCSLPEAPRPSDLPSKLPFSEDHLPYLASIAQGSSLGLSKLYDLFVMRCGRVSKKQFELRLNQIAEKKAPSPGTKPTWCIRPEYAKLLSNYTVMSDLAEDVVQQVKELVNAE